jgi:hypothetical protein
MHGHKEKSAERAVFISVALVLAAFSVYNLVYCLRITFLPYDIDYSEAVILATRLQYLYKDFSSYPYLITYYPPIYYALVDAFRALYSTALPYFYTRSLAVFATLADALMLYFIACKSFGRKNGAALLAPLMFLSCLPVSVWGVSSGPTQFELLFDLISIFLLLNYTKKRSLVYSSIALAVAFFFKQSALLVFLAVAAYLALNRRPDDLALFAIPFLVIAVPITLLLDLLTSGRYVFSLFTLPLITSSDFQHFVVIADTLLFDTPFLAFLPFAAYWIYKNPRSLLALSFALSFASLLSAIKVGSSLMYFMGLFALFCVISALGVERILSERKQAYRWAATACMAVLLMAMVLNTVPKFLSLSDQSAFQPSATAEVGYFLRNFSGNVLVESPSVAVAANKSVMFEPSEFGAMLDRGLWNDSQIVNDIAAHRFSAIAFPAGEPVMLEGHQYYEYPYGRFVSYPDITSAIRQYYHISYLVYGWAVCTPNA